MKTIIFGIMLSIGTFLPSFANARGIWGAGACANVVPRYGIERLTIKSRLSECAKTRARQALYDYCDGVVMNERITTPGGRDCTSELWSDGLHVACAVRVAGDCVE